MSIRGGCVPSSGAGTAGVAGFVRRWDRPWLSPCGCPALDCRLGAVVMGQGRGRRLCGADRLSARWESTHGVCTESRGFRGRRASDEGESAFDGERPGSRVPFSAHAVRFAPRNRAAEAPGSRGFRRGRVLCLGWREVPSGGDGCALVRGSAFDEVRPGSGYLPRLMLSAYASRNRLWRHPLPGRSGEQVVVPWLVRNAFRRRWLHLAWKKCLRWGGAP